MNEDHVQAIANHVETFVRSRFQVQPDDAGFTRRVHLWEAGYVDSMGAIELIHNLERSFQITLPDTALFSEGFTSIDGIARIVASLQDAAARLVPPPQRSDQVA